jgi:hypothetical protein
MIHAQIIYVVTDPWGSIAEWVAGIGTLAAVSVSLYVVLGDRRKQARSEADSLGTWSKVDNSSYTIGKQSKTSKFWVETNFYNAGGRPVPYVSLSWWDGARWNREMGMASGKHSEPYTISPGEDGLVQAPVDRNVPLNWENYFITFTDGSGATWFRSPENNRYLSARTMKRLAKHGPKPLKKTKP